MTGGYRNPIQTAGGGGGGSGDVVGPASAVNNNIVVFNTTTGKLIKDGGNTIAQVKDRANHTGTQTASTISDFQTQVSANSNVTANTAKVSATTENVRTAGALMDDEITNLAQVKAFDSSDYATAAQGALADSALQNLVEDTTPQLGGNLDLNGNVITGLEIGTDIQAYNAKLTSIAGLTPGAEGKMITSNGLGGYQISTVADVRVYLNVEDGAEVNEVTLAGAETLTNKDLSSGTNTFPTFNQNTTGTAANLSGTPALPNGTTATTQTAGDNSTKLATTAYVDAPTSINTQTGTTYTLVLTDASKLITLTNASAITLTIPTNASVAFPVGTQIDLSQDGAGAVTIGGAGVTINSLDGNKTINGQYVGATLIKMATDTWNLYGNLTA